MNKWQWIVLASGIILVVAAIGVIMYVVAIPFFGQAVLALLLACGLAALGAMYVGSLMWVYTDAKQRGRSPEVVMILVAVCAWPLSVLLWRLSRPELEIGGVKIIESKKAYRMQ